ncbi:MAG: type I restriction endonuclease subunit R [Candidatus Moranbacteria bacterium]|jgi:type I restriction enzyme R subunit|nr:type I restriction endonuclease subunit R [Candidatus Moranbacteria bacterium]
MTKITESHVEELVINLLESQGWKYLSPEDQEQERESLSEVVLRGRLREAIDRINPNVNEAAREQALRAVLSLPSQNLMDNNEVLHKMLTDGVEVEYLQDDNVKGDKVWLVDFENIENNDFVVCNQFTVIENEKNKRPDAVLLVNGLPLVVIELKNAADENATVKKAFTQLQNYKTAIPSLFFYNSILIASDGLDAKAGTVSAGWTRFLAWKTKDGAKEEKKTVPQIETMILGMLSKEVLLDLIKYFTVFEKSKKVDPETEQIFVETVKKVAAYHQYYAVKKAVESTLRAVAEADVVRERPEAYGLFSVASQPKGDRKAGVVWHTQGSGKSLSMVFYAGKIVQEKELKNPTIVVITDRNDLDDQLFDTFASCKQILRQEPAQAKNRNDLKEKLKVAGGGIVFTTIQKFSPEDGGEVFDMLSERKNIIVIADEAHRSQYGFGAKTVYEKDDEGKEIGTRTVYGFAKYLRDGLPNATFIGFTGTPIEKEDASTPAVFGNYVDVYDIAQAVEDCATVRIFYESRLAKIHLKPEEKEKLDAEVEKITEGAESTAEEKAKAKWTQLEAIVGHNERIKSVAADIVDHFEKRQEVFEGKAMIVAMSRRIAVELYEEIVKLRPEWHDSDKKKGVIKVVMTSSSSDPENWQMHSTTKQERKDLGERMKDVSDPLKLVIVRDMWLTGFDVPCLHTMYIDKLMKGHNLMQAIARVNRVFKDKPGGLIVDYIGFASELKKALAIYTESGGKGQPTLDQNEAIATMLEKYEILVQMFGSFDYKKYFAVDTAEKLRIILEAQEHILGLEDGENRFKINVDALSKAFALSVPSLKALEIKDEVGFFQAVKARLVKFEPGGFRKSDEEIETAIRQIVDRAVVSDGIIDVFDAAGIKKPDISILSDEFLEEIKGMKRKNLALELLKKILNDEIRSRSKRNLIQSKKLSEMLENAIRKYQNNLLTAAQIIEELIKIAKEVRESDMRGKEMNLSVYELAFYDALANNDSAKEVMSTEVLRELAMVLVDRVKSNTAIDWTIKESVKARLRAIVKRTLRVYGYPPDMQKLATENILKQAELLADELTD